MNEVQTLRGIIHGRYYHGHAFLIDYFRLRYVLCLAGFERIEVFTDRYSPSSIALSPMVPFLFAALKLSIRMSFRRARKKAQKPTPSSILREIQSHLFSRALLFGKSLIVVAQKKADLCQHSPP